MSSNTSGRRIGIAAAGFWLLMMGLLAYRELGPALFSPAFKATRVEELREPAESWMGLFVEEERVGHVHIRQTPEERFELSGVTLDVAVRANLSLLGRVTDLDLSGSVWRPYDSKRADFDFAVRSGAYDFRVSGRLADGVLKADVVSAGETLPFEVPVDDVVVFSGGFGTALEFPSLEVGQEVRLESFDPLTLQKSSMRVRCVAKEPLELDTETIPTSRLEVTASGIRSLVWIDDRGDVVKMKTPLGLTLRRIASEALTEAHRYEVSST